MATKTRAEPRPRWRNWAGNQECAPAVIEAPSTEDELFAIVRGAAEAEQHLKVVGTGHSFTGIALTDGRLVRLDNYQRILNTDRERTFAAEQGERIAQLVVLPVPRVAVREVDELTGSERGGRGFGSSQTV